MAKASQGPDLDSSEHDSMRAVAEIVAFVERDLESTYPDLRLFQRGRCAL